MVRARNLTVDGLPELSGLFSPEAIRAAEAAAEEGAAAAGSNLFEAEPPPEPPTALDLPFAVPSPAWAPEELARGFAAAESRTGATTAGERHYWRDQLAFWTDELAASKEEGELSGPALALRAVTAARAAEQAGQPDAAQRLYDEALGHDPACLAALRGLLRLREPGPLTEGAQNRLTALSRACEDERAAYEAILAECAGAAVPVEGAAGAPSPTRALADAALSLHAGRNGDAAEAMAAAGRQLGGAVGAALLAEAARLRELRGETGPATELRGEARGLHAVEPAVAFGELRRAVALPPGEALSVIESTVDALPAPALRAAVLRWAARLARVAGDPARGRAFLARAARALHESKSGASAPAELPERDRITFETAEAAEGGVAGGLSGGLSPEGEVLVALRAEVLGVGAAQRGGPRDLLQHHRRLVLPERRVAVGVLGVTDERDERRLALPVDNPPRADEGALRAEGVGLVLDHLALRLVEGEVFFLVDDGACDAPRNRASAARALGAHLPRPGP